MEGHKVRLFSVTGIDYLYGISCYGHKEPSPFPYALLCFLAGMGDCVSVTSYQKCTRRNLLSVTVRSCQGVSLHCAGDFQAMPICARMKADFGLFG
jgi:hypothetical protein